MITTEEERKEVIKKKREYQKQYRKKNKEKINALNRKYRSTEKYRSYRKKNLKKIQETKKKWIEKNKDKVLELGRKYAKKYRSKNLDKARESNRKWQKKWRKNLTKEEREKLNKSNNEYVKRRLKIDKNFSLTKIVRSRLAIALKHQKTVRHSRSLVLLGCSISDLRKYLEKKFKPGMTWKNHGFNGWHIDHIKPLSKFNLEDPEQQKIAFHFTNLQPLWAKENLKKSDKY